MHFLTMWGTTSPTKAITPKKDTATAVISEVTTIPVIRVCCGIEHPYSVHNRRLNKAPYSPSVSDRSRSGPESVRRLKRVISTSHYVPDRRSSRKRSKPTVRCSLRIHDRNAGTEQGVNDHSRKDDRFDRGLFAPDDDQNDSQSQQTA